MVSVWDRFALILCVAVGYFVGAFPTGYYLVRLVTLKDIRRFGSGNIGATNVARMMGLAYFPVVFFVDSAKAWGVLMFAKWFWPSVVQSPILFVIAGAVMIGNGYSVFLGFGGGKGVSTAIGVFAAVFSFSYALQLCEILLLVAVIARSMAFSSVVVFAFLPMAHLVLRVYLNLSSVLFVSCVSVWIAYRHRSNLVAWLNGKEKNEIFGDH